MIKFESLHITHEILAVIAEIDEFKGAWKALGQQQPEILTSLKLAATIESIGSSTRIEGSKLSDTEVEALLANLQIKKFDTRDAQEVAGYGEVMNVVFENFEEIPLSENYIQQLHNELLKYSEKDYWHRGYYKKSPNHVEAFDASGKSLGIVFETASPFETPIKMATLIKWANQFYVEKKLHPLLTTAIFIVEFLAIHPFQDGNGRLSRVLTTFLLLKCGYLYVPFSSLEAVVEQSKEGYYLSLRQTQGTLQSGTPNWQPWVLFFLKALQQQKLRLERKLEKQLPLPESLPVLSSRIIELVKAKGRATKSELASLTHANGHTIKKHLELLVSSRRLQKNGVGKATWYSLPLNSGSN